MSDRVLVSPGKGQGIGGFLFDIAAGEELEVESSINRHYAEGGMLLSDHVTLKPLKLRLKGYVGSLGSKREESGGNIAENPVKRLLSYPLVPGFSLLSAALVKGSTALEMLAVTAGTLYRQLTAGFASASSETKALNFFIEAWRQKLPLSVDSEHFRFDNMVIERIIYRQDEVSSFYSSFVVELSQVDFFSDFVEAAGSLIQRFLGEEALCVNKGSSEGSYEAPEKLKSYF
jgi:hypothetical protein